MIDFKASNHWNCDGCQYNGIPIDDDDECDLCGYTGCEIRKWIQDRETVNILIDEYNKGNILLNAQVIYV